MAYVIRNRWKVLPFRCDVVLLNIAKKFCIKRREKKNCIINIHKEKENKNTQRKRERKRRIDPNTLKNWFILLN